MKNKNITLRYIKESDIADYIRWTTTETEWCQWDAPWEEDDNEEFVQRQRDSLGKAPARYSKLEIDTADGRHIGWVSAYRIDSEKLAVGLDIPAVCDRGQGYGYNALTLFMKYLFEHESMLYTQTWSGNTPMIRLAEKIGFTECDRIPGIREVRGQKYDALTFAITKTDFNTRSCKLAERLGYKLVSKTPKDESPKSKFDMNYAMTKVDYFMKIDGLIPAIVQDFYTGRVLMLAYVNQESYDFMLKHGETCFWSRSRQELWHKGATSGNVQIIKHMTFDCDNDTLLIQVQQTGNGACHTGSFSCFGDENGEFNILDKVAATIKERSQNPAEKSYTNYLLDKGVDKICKKVGEEASETIIAAKNRNKDELTEEISDLLYHLLVLMHEQGVELADIQAKLAGRYAK